MTDFLLAGSTFHSLQRSIFGAFRPGRALKTASARYFDGMGPFERDLGFTPLEGIFSVFLGPARLSRLQARATLAPWAL